MIGSTQEFKYKVLAATCARSDCHSGGRGRSEAMAAATMASAAEFSQSIQVPSSTNPGTTYPVRASPHSDIHITFNVYTKSLVRGSTHTSRKVVGSCTNDHTQCILPKRRVKFDILGKYLHSATEVHRSFKPEGFTQEAPNVELPRPRRWPASCKKRYMVRCTFKTPS